jgi:hypothetical protein
MSPNSLLLAQHPPTFHCFLVLIKSAHRNAGRLDILNEFTASPHLGGTQSMDKRNDANTPAFVLSIFPNHFFVVDVCCPTAACPHGINMKLSLHRPRMNKLHWRAAQLFQGWIRGGGGRQVFCPKPWYPRKALAPSIFARTGHPRATTKFSP